MSRTDKDAPWWLNASWMPQHSYSCTWWGTRACSLPDTPPKRPPIQRRVRREVDPFVSGYSSWMVICHWRPADTRRWKDAVPQPPKWFRDHVWTSAERAAVRDDCRRAEAEHRAGDVDVIPSVRQHRHGASWLWY